MFYENNNKIIEGTIEEILNFLKSRANPNCNKCYGRGHNGYTEDKQGKRCYIPCKCIKNK